MNKINGMWYINIQSKSPKNNAPLNNLENTVYEIRKKDEIVNYFYQAMWNPVPATWIKATKADFLPHRQE